MARTSANKQSTARREKEDDAVDVLDALATRLGALGKRKWKTKDLAAALNSAAGGLEDEAVKSYILGNLEQCAAQLHERLLAVQESEAAGEAASQPPASAEVPPAKRAKRGKRAAAGAPPELEVAEEAEELAPATLATAQGYTQLAAEAADGQLDPRFTTVDLLLARTLPAEGLAAAHVRRLHSEDGGAPQQGAQALVAAAATALAASAALAAEADTPEDALRMFAPAVAHLCAAQEQLAVEAQSGAAEESGTQLEGELGRLAGRTLASMHAALQRQTLGGSGGDQTACYYWRSNPQRLSAGAAVEAAGAVGAAICGLRTSLRLRAAGGQPPTSQALLTLGAAAAADLRLLAPFAPSGQLSTLARMPLDEAQASPVSARRFLALYIAVGGMEAAGAADYLHRLAAARSAAAVAAQLGEGGLGARILDEATRAPVSQEFVVWLSEQPPSAIVSTALAASRGGPTALSQHLARECSERGLQALLAAMQRGAAAGGGAEPGEGGVAGEEALLDDLLFFSDRAGDATMFDRDWGTASDDGDDAGEGGERGVDLGELPDANQRDELLQG